MVRYDRGDPKGAALKTTLLNNGIFVTNSPRGFISAAHSDEDIDWTIDVIGDFSASTARSWYRPTGLGAGQQLENMAVGVPEVEALATPAGVDLHILQLKGPAPVGDSLPLIRPKTASNSSSLTWKA